MPEVGVDLCYRLAGRTVDDLDIDGQRHALFLFNNVAADELAVDVYYNQLVLIHSGLEVKRGLQ